MVELVFLMFTTAWLLSACATSDVHKHMTIEELQSTFHVDSHDLVPKYEVVEVHHHMKRRSIDRSSLDNVVEEEGSKPKKQYGKSSNFDIKSNTANLRLNAFGKPVNLSLVKTEGLFKRGGLKLWTVEPNATSQHGVEYVEIPETSDDDIGEIYQDEDNQAAILLRKDEKNGALIVEGSIGSDLIIRPIPSRLRSKLNHTEDDTNANDDEMFLDADGELSAEVAIDTGLPIKRKMETSDSHRHIIYRRKGNDDDSMNDYALMEPDHLSKRYRRSILEKIKNNFAHLKRKREAPYTIYPEILVIVDYDGYRLHGGDNLQIKRYFVSFWNGVDLRYKLLKGPKIRISIAGIIISRGRDATPYLERNRVGRDAIDSAAALTDMGKYLFRERRLPVYDIAVAITKYDMCRRRKGGRCTKGTAGFAYVGGACVVNKRLEKVNSVAIIEDTGGFSGIIVAAHEVGHLLGAVHDGSPPPSYLGGPGAEKCQWTDGYIMSDLRHTERGFRWSPCSISSFHHFLNGDTATCLYNAPHEDDSLPRVLPGKLLTLDAQCRRDRGTSACFKDDRVCAQLFCFDAGSGYCVAYRPAAEGSACGDGQYCLNGRCVAEHENIIPDYSQNTPSYIRGNGNQGRPLFHDDEDDEIYQNPNPPTTYVEQPTPPPYQYNYQQQTDNPYNYNQYFPTTTTQRPYYFETTQRQTYTSQNYYTTARTSTYRPFGFSFSTTKSPYDFKDFGKQYTNYQSSKNYYPTTLSVYNTPTTKNPYIGNYFQLRKQTTRNPYDFAHFGKTRNYHDNVNNNYLKRSYNSASYYSDSSNVRNYTTNLNFRRVNG